MGAYWFPINDVVGFALHDDQEDTVMLRKGLRLECECGRGEGQARRNAPYSRCRDRLRFEPFIKLLLTRILACQPALHGSAWADSEPSSGVTTAYNSRSSPPAGSRFTQRRERDRHSSQSVLLPFSGQFLLKKSLRSLVPGFAAPPRSGSTPKISCNVFKVELWS